MVAVVAAAAGSSSDDLMYHFDLGDVDCSLARFSFPVFYLPALDSYLTICAVATTPFIQFCSLKVTPPISSGPSVAPTLL